MRGAMRGVGLIIAVAACGEPVVVSPGDGARLPGGSVTATVVVEESRPGGVLDIRFENTGPTRYWFNPCNRVVERREGDRWVALPPELRVCTAEAYALDAGSTRVERTDVPADATAGTHRFVFPMVADHAGAETVQIRSTPVTVR